MKREWEKILHAVVMFAALSLALTLAGCGTADNASRMLTGILETEELALTAPSEGRLMGLIVTPGERISKGQPLFALEDKEGDASVQKTAANLARAEAELKAAKSSGESQGIVEAKAYDALATREFEAARAEYEKMKKLYAVGGISKVRCDEAEARWRFAQAEYEAARAQTKRPADAGTIQQLEEKVKLARAAYDGALLAQGKREISAPCTAEIVETLLKNGDVVTQGQKILTIRPLTSCIIKAEGTENIPQKFLQEGQPAKLKSGGYVFMGRVLKAEKGMLTLTSDAKPEELTDGSLVEINFEQRKF